MFARSVITASREEHLGLALEAEIRSRVNQRRTLRHLRDTGVFVDLERQNALILRELFRVRRDALRQYAATEEHVTRAWREMKAASDAAWSVALLAGPGDPLPDVPLARLSDPGDHYVGMPR